MARVLLLAATLALLIGAPAADARRLVVNAHGDHRPGRCTPADCTLREAVRAANKRAGADTIVLRSRRRAYTLARRSTGEDRARNGDLDITSGPLRIIHPGRGRATIDGNGVDRVFDIGAARTTLRKLVIRGGRAHRIDGDGDGGGILIGDFGDAPVRIVNSVITDNRSPGRDGNGGGIDSDSTGQLTVLRSVVKRNVAGGDSGGVAGSLEGPVLIEKSTIRGNRAAEGGGVLAVGPPVTIVESTIAHNQARGGRDGEVGDGGGLYVDDEGELVLINSTVTENIATGSGGGIFGETGAQAAIHSSTIARNRADSDDSGAGTGGGILIDISTFEVANSIIALNTGNQGAPTDCGGQTYTGAAPNLISTDEGPCGPGAFLVADPLLDRRLSRAAGGPTPTLWLREGSPAIGAADPALSPPRDQRGRPRDDDPDLGAVERRFFPEAPDSISAR